MHEEKKRSVHFDLKLNIVDFIKIKFIKKLQPPFDFSFMDQSSHSLIIDEEIFKGIKVNFDIGNSIENFGKKNIS